MVSKKGNQKNDKRGLASADKETKQKVASAGGKSSGTSKTKKSSKK